jgi:hypothetical protein
MLHFMGRPKIITPEGSQAVPVCPFETRGRTTRCRFGISKVGNEIHFMTFKFDFFPHR